MATSLHTISRTTTRKSMRVGRGGKRGKTAGRGTKGQNARAGNKKRPELRDIIKKLPKRRGYGKNRGTAVVGSRPDARAISLTLLNTLFEVGAEVTQKSFATLVRGRGRSSQPIKIVGSGEISKKLVIKGVPTSASAKSAIEKAGGTVS